MQKILSLTLALLLIFGCAGCARTPGETTAERYEDYALDMNTDFPCPDSLPDGGGQTVKVILLLGQSNASGCSVAQYLQGTIPDEEYAQYQAGFSNILINYCVDDHNNTSGGNFLPVDLTCGAYSGVFGPEVGIAAELDQAFPGETFLILKYTMSGYSLNHHWLFQGERASIYNAFLIFAQTYLELLKEKNYVPEIGAVCWMQGESDTTEEKAARYYENQVAFVSYLREDLADYSIDGGFYFIDAGISDSPYCLPAYPTINAAKEQFSQLSPRNRYFSTIAAGLTTLYEPDYEPDLGHYDAWCELELGKLFGKEIVDIYRET